MSRKHYFFYDESEHSRKINKATFNADNYYDNFVTAVVGWKDADRGTIGQRYNAFENKHAERKVNGEIKSSTLKPKSFINGLASFSKPAIGFLKDFLDIFDEKMLLHFSVISKAEYLVHQMFLDYNSVFIADIDAMKYTIIKSFISYRPKEIIEAFFENPSELIPLLRKFYKNKIKENEKNLKLKKLENKAFSEIILLLDEINCEVSKDWNYDIALFGFSRYVQEIGIKEIKLFTDREGDGSGTINSAKKLGFLDAEETDSKDSIGIRIADILAGVISKLLKSLKKAREYNNESEQFQKKILNEKWFNLNEQQFILYKRLAYIILKLNDAWFKSYGGIYSDDLISLVSLLGYIDRYASLDELNKNAGMHGEYLNSYTCENLKEYFDKHFIKSIPKPKIDLIPETDEDFFYNQRGAKVYFDDSKQPLINIPNDSICVEVLSVGFTKDNTPTLTVSENGKPICYRLPAELFNWASQCVSLAHGVMNIFPSRVVFSKKSGRYFADIL